MPRRDGPSTLNRIHAIGGASSGGHLASLGAVTASDEQLEGDIGDHLGEFVAPAITATMVGFLAEKLGS